MAPVGKYRNLDAGHSPDALSMRTRGVNYTPCGYGTEVCFDGRDRAVIQLDASHFGLFSYFDPCRPSCLCEAHGYTIGVTESVPPAKSSGDDSVDRKARRKPRGLIGGDDIDWHSQPALQSNATLEFSQVALRRE